MSKHHKGNPYRKIYVEHYGPIPKGYHVHHIDHNPLNNDPKNLVAVSPEDHAKLHGDEFTKWASEGGRKGGIKCREEGLGWFAEGNTRFSGKRHTEESRESASKNLKEKYASGEKIHWTNKYSKEEVSRKISAGDPGKSMRGKTPWNKGKSFTNSEQAKNNKSIAAKQRAKYPCEKCGKEFDAGNLKRHLNANKCRVH